MERIMTLKTPNHIGEKVRVAGWVHARRDHGKLTFIDLRDASGILQVVFSGIEEAKELRDEWVVEVEGEMKERPDTMVNKEIPTGSVELKADSLVVLNTAQTPPFPLDIDGYNIGEELRLKYRYLDLRRERLRRNLVERHKVMNFFREYLTEQQFTEVETPIISKSTPEGARDYVIPSRQHPGKFYALPQSPQQYKQLLMVAGLEKYFQIVRCFRDEDTRGDRQPEFTQLDIEASFVTQEDILGLVEKMIIELVQLHFPQKKISKIPFPRLEYDAVIKEYGNDRPDLRENPQDPDELSFAFIINFPMFEKKEDGSLGAVHHPFTMPQTTDTKALVKSPLDIKAYQYDLVLNGFEVAGGSMRTHDPSLLQAVFETLGHKTEDVQQKFGHLLEAFTYGVPPHGGIAFGLDRLFAILFEEPNIREVIAFPKTGDGRDLMMDAPSDIDKNQLDELGLSLKKKKE